MNKVLIIMVAMCFISLSIGMVSAVESTSYTLLEAEKIAQGIPLDDEIVLDDAIVIAQLNQTEMMTLQEEEANDILAVLIIGGFILTIIFAWGFIFWLYATEHR